MPVSSILAIVGLVLFVAALASLIPYLRVLKALWEYSNTKGLEIFGEKYGSYEELHYDIRFLFNLLKSKAKISAADENQLAMLRKLKNCLLFILFAYTYCGIGMVLVNVTGG